MEEPTLGEAVELFLKSRQGCRRATRDHYRWVLTLFVEEVGDDRKIAGVDETTISDWLAIATANPSTRFTYFTRVKIAFNYFRDKGLVTSNPCTNVSIPRPPDRIGEKCITPSDLDLLVRTAESSSVPYMSLVIVTAFDLALRLTEVCEMRIRWLSNDFEWVTIQAEEGFAPKSGRPVTKPISRRLRSLLEPQVRRSDSTGRVFLNNMGNALNPKHTSKQFKRLVRLTGLPESITFHGLRHGGITDALKRGASLEAVRMFAGHRSLETTSRYLHLRPNDYAKQIVDNSIVKDTSI